MPFPNVFRSAGIIPSYLTFAGMFPSRLFFLVCFLPLRVLEGYAQTDTVLQLPPATVSEARFERTGFSVWHADSLPVEGVLSLADRLALDNALLLRTQAPGGLATVSARGAGPNRTAVVWQGINLQNSMNGVVDASLLPLWRGDRVVLRYGGQSAAQSSGAMGGVLFVDADEQSPAGFSGAATAAAGSFGRMESSLQTAWSSPVFTSTLRAGYQQAENNFPFQNTTQIGAPYTTQVNNALRRFDLQQFNSWAPATGQLIKSAFWHQRASREIPPPMTAAPQQTWQDDVATRVVAGWEKNTGTGARWNLRGAWLDESIAYFLNGDNENSRARTAQALGQYSAVLGKRWFVKTGAQAWWQQARSDGYADNTSWSEQQRLALLGTVEYHADSWLATAQVRKEWVSTTPETPVTWSLGAEKNLGNEHLVRFHAARTFNLPTFNDLYWKTLGNPDLRAENGYSFDAGYQGSINAGVHGPMFISRGVFRCNTPTLRTRRYIPPIRGH